MHNSRDQWSLVLGTAWSQSRFRQTLASGWHFPMGTVLLWSFSQQADPGAVVALLLVVSIFFSVLIIRRVKLNSIS